MSRSPHLASALRNSPLFGSLTERASADLEAEFELLTMPSGEILCREGEAGDCLYLITSGRVRVSAGREGDGKVLAELGAGQVVGEMALLTGAARSATVETIRDTQLARLSVDSFYRVLERHPRTLMQSFTRTIVQRLVPREVHAARAGLLFSTVAVVASRTTVPIQSFCARLAEALKKIGSTAHITASAVDRQLGRQGASRVAMVDPASDRIVQWLGEQEQAFRYCVYQADADFTLWTERCLRQADHILIVTDADAPTSVGAVEARVLESEVTGHRRRSLILLQGPDLARPSDTARWLAARRVDRHHHVRLSNDADFDRLARVLTGTAVGLVLGGGGARGFAHAGVIRALREADVPIDLVGGTSVGATFAAQCALGWGSERMLHESLSLASTLVDFTVPIVSLAAGRAFAMSLERYFGSTCIEDLWLPFFCVSTNLTRAEVAVHRQGPLALALRASNNAPGIYPPLPIDGDLHVDGAVLNNLPVDVMASAGDVGTLIAVDVSPAAERLEGSMEDVGVAGWRLLLRKLNPFAPPIRAPSLVDVVMRATSMSGMIRERLAVTELVDLHLRPPVERFGLMDHKLGNQIAHVAYRDARERIAAWRADRGG